MLYVEIFYPCLLWIIRRRDIYFLIIYYNCVIYRFNRNRALQGAQRYREGIFGRGTYDREKKYACEILSYQVANPPKIKD